MMMMMMLRRSPDTHCTRQSSSWKKRKEKKKKKKRLSTITSKFFPSLPNESYLSISLLLPSLTPTPTSCCEDW